jgi:NitT/TauT family transport system ATP-binding protein
LGTAILFVTHNIDEAVYLANRVILLGGRPSGVLREYDVDLPTRRWEQNIYGEPGFIDLRQELRAALLGLDTGGPTVEAPR